MFVLPRALRGLRWSVTFALLWSLAQISTAPAQALAPGAIVTDWRLHRVDHGVSAVWHVDAAGPCGVFELLRCDDTVCAPGSYVLVEGSRRACLPEGQADLAVVDPVSAHAEAAEHSYLLRRIDPSGLTWHYGPLRLIPTAAQARLSEVGGLPTTSQGSLHETGCGG